MIYHKYGSSVTALLVMGFAFALLASCALWFIPPFTVGERIDLDAMLPFIGDNDGVSQTTIMPGESGSSPQHGVAGLVLISVAAVAGLPLLVGSSLRRPVLYACAAAVTLFAVGTILRNGLFFLPSAGLLCLAAVKCRNADRSPRHRTLGPIRKM